MTRGPGLRLTPPAMISQGRRLSEGRRSISIVYQGLHGTTQYSTSNFSARFSVVGGWTNPFEKYSRQNGNLPQKRGENEKYVKPPPSFTWRIIPWRNVNGFDNHGDRFSPLSVGLWDPFQMAEIYGL